MYVMFSLCDAMTIPATQSLSSQSEFDSSSQISDNSEATVIEHTTVASVEDDPPLSLKASDLKMQQLQLAIIRLREENDELRLQNSKLNVQMIEYRKCFEQAEWKQKAAERTAARLNREMSALMAALAPTDPVETHQVDYKPATPNTEEIATHTPDGGGTVPQDNLKYMWESTKKIDKYGIHVEDTRSSADLWHTVELEQLTIPELQTLVKQLRKKCVFLERSRQSVLDELEELTQTLFEESNKLVHDEASARWDLEQSKAKLGMLLISTMIL